ncbi:MAG: IS256 family transposase [Candidatus Scalindua sp.]|jgi:transposase-like protein|nr:IS256 family transposase [Candidatus Scalindua sp.]
MVKKKQDKIDKLIEELTKDSTAEDILGESGLLKDLKKRLIETALDAEMTEHLGYEKNSTDGNGSGNSRNGKTSKRIIGSDYDVDIDVPRDRNGDFEPKLVRKRQVRLPGFDNNVISLYSRGMTTREIQEHLFEIYDVDVSPSLISRVTDSVLDEVSAWQSRPLDNVYPIVYLDAIHLKIRTEGKVQNRAVYVALGVTMEGQKDLLGLWIGQSEGAKFWLNILTELQNRGIKDILIAAVDGLTGFPDAIATIYPKTEVQLCIVHMVRNSMRYVPWKDRKAVVKDLKKVYGATTAEAGKLALDSFEKTWSDKYPMAAKSWRTRWDNVIPFFDYPDPIRKAIYTTNAIESLNAQLRKVTRKRGAFPTEDAVRKILYLAISKASKKWTMPIRNWPEALNFFSIKFEGRIKV